MQYLPIFAVSLLLLLSGCQTAEQLPSEDLEVLDKYADLIRIMQNPRIPPNSKEKYEAARKMIRVIDFTYTRETKTINDLLYHGDALIDRPNAQDRTISFNYQYGDHYVRLVFHTFRNFVVKVVVTEQ